MFVQQLFEFKGQEQAVNRASNVVTIFHIISLPEKYVQNKATILTLQF
jgi:hypothetical protein